MKMPKRRAKPRLVMDGDNYTIDDDVDLLMVTPAVLVDVEIAGEPWGWTKPGPKPVDWPGPDHPRTEPGPFDGEWELPL